MGVVRIIGLFNPVKIWAQGFGTKARHDHGLSKISQGFDLVGNEGLSLPVEQGLHRPHAAGSPGRRDDRGGA